MFRCYTEDEDGGYTAWFGYNNLNDHNVYITASRENYISGAMTTAMPPTLFRPGTMQYGFSIK